MKTRVKRNEGLSTTEYMSDEIKSMSEYEKIIEDRGSREDQVGLVSELAELTMSKKVLKQFLISYLDSDMFPYATVLSKQNISKLVGTTEFDLFIKGLENSSSLGASFLFTKQKWRANQLKGLMGNYKLLDLATNGERFAEMISILMTNNRIPYEEMIDYIESAELNRPRYFGSEHSFRGMSCPYEVIGASLLKTYEVPKDYVMKRCEMFNERIFQRSTSFRIKDFVTKGFSFSEILQMHGGRFAEIRLGFLVEWLKSDARIVLEEDLPRVRICIETIKNSRYHSEESLVELLVEIHKERNSFLNIEESTLAQLLRKVSLSEMIWSDAMLLIPEELSEEVYHSINNEGYSSHVIVGKAKPTMESVLEAIEDPNSRVGSPSKPMRVLASYETLRHWHEQDKELFKEMSNHIDLNSDRNDFYTNVTYNAEFLSFLREHFEEKVETMSSCGWGQIFKDNKIEDGEAFGLAIDSLRRDMSNDRGSLSRTSVVRDIFANMHGKIEIETLKEFAEHLNFIHDIRVLDGGLKNALEKGEF